VRAFLTGGTGFIGGHVARKLRERGDEVAALVRSPERASALRDLGCELVQGDLSDEEAIRRGAEGSDAAFHVGAVYKVGVPKSEHPLMGFPPNLAELIKVSDGVTYWAKDDKARRELGFRPRDLETGLKQTLASAGA
jgi:nucleoside-diphosphate-sugar epimerase